MQFAAPTFQEVLSLEPLSSNAYNYASLIEIVLILF